MVKGIESFRKKFMDYRDCYTVIGGAACDILMSEEDLSFRATKDLDMILLLEDRYQEFAKVFWEYIKEGGYRCGWKNSKDVHFYRFTDPKPGYPIQIEHFSRLPDYHLSVESGIILGGMSLKKCLRSKNRTQYRRQLGRKAVKNQRQKIGEGKLQQRDTKGYQVKFYKLPRGTVTESSVDLFKERNVYLLS